MANQELRSFPQTLTEALFCAKDCPSQPGKQPSPAASLMELGSSREDRQWRMPTMAGDTKIDRSSGKTL